MLQLKSSEFILPKAKNIIGDDACGFTQLDDDVFISVLCDGVGSAKKGGAAARQTVKFFLSQFKTRPKAWSIDKSIITFAEHINRLLFKESMTQYEAIELLTTICVVAIKDNQLYTMNAGDSRIYLLDRSNQLKQLSIDDNYDEEHLSHVLTKAVGLSDQIEIEVQSHTIEVGDKIILCSDGVTSLINDTELQQQIQKGLSAKLIVNAAAKGHKDNERDDISLQIFSVEKLSPLTDMKNLELTIPESLKSGDIIDGYELTQSLMEHGRIFKAIKNSKEVVLKFPMVAAIDDESSLDEFVREAWYAKQITHKAFGDAWIPQDRTYRYYAMELIEGTNLLEYLKNQTLSIDNAIHLAKFLHKAEAHLLHLGLVHGDIKPENIIVYSRQDEAGVDFKMVDFGSIVEVFATNSRAGTPSYLAPERFLGQAISEASEIFSIGVTLYWALTSKLPYGEIEPFQTPKFKQAHPPSKYNKNIPPWLDSIILRAISVEEDRRYNHYSEFFYELKAPQNVKPFFDKNAPLIQREPLMVYKVGFYIMIIVNVLLIISYEL
jgi:serine/threonine protein phosphatase PrpC